MSKKPDDIIYEQNGDRMDYTARFGTEVVYGTLIPEKDGFGVDKVSFQVNAIGGGSEGAAKHEMESVRNSIRDE